MSVTELCAIIAAIASFVMMLVKITESEKTLAAIRAARTHAFFRYWLPLLHCMAGVGALFWVLSVPPTSATVVVAALGAVSLTLGLMVIFVMEVAFRIIDRLADRVTDDSKG